MDFYTAAKLKRPVRLSEATRRFAYESLNHKYGLDTKKTPNVSLKHIENYKNFSDIEKYNAAIFEIATKAPVRICDGELISGAATLGDAMRHMLPAVYGDEGRRVLSGISHLTVDFSEVLEIGMDGILKKAQGSLENHTAPRKREFIKSCIHCIECMRLWHGRYISALKAAGGYEENIKNLERVPFAPAENFYEAVQSVWFCFAFLRLTGCWTGIGRIDALLGKYLKADLARGAVTLTDAREILAHFFIKGCEWITGDATTSGDAQHYQNIVLSGRDKNGNDVTNEVTYLVLDIIEETGISDFPTTVKINKDTDGALLRRVAEVIRYGGGIVAVYNEELILRSLADMGYAPDEAAEFANDGCWEVQIPGRTRFSYVPFDGLSVLQKLTLKDYDGTAFDSFEELLCRYQNDIADTVAAICEKYIDEMTEADNITFKRATACTVPSLFEHPCVERGLSYFEGGTQYTVISPHIGGLPDAVNSLYAIKKAVFDDKLLTFPQFMEILKNDWENCEELRLKMLRGYSYYGTDNDEVDCIAVRILDGFSEACRKYDGRTPIRFVSGVSTFGRQIEWAKSRNSTPFGRKRGDVLSGNLSPTPGTDNGNPADIIRSYCKADLAKQHTGAALDIGFVPRNTDSENAVIALEGIIKSFVQLGGYFMQIDTADKNTLIEAQKHPENYKNLSVRVSGWNARFVTMSKEWQDMIIERTK